MKFLHYEFDLTSADVVEVTLDRQANVILLDDINFASFRRGGRYKYLGGLAKVSPMRIGVPIAGHWNLVINLGGYSGTVNAAVRIIKNKD
jgi:hypothetical protein